MTERIIAGYSSGGIGDVLAAFASGVTLVTVADGRDDIGTTVSAFCPVLSCSAGLTGSRWPAVPVPG